MEFSHIAFAFFVFLLICEIIFLYMKLKKPSKKAGDPMSDREKKLFTLYQHLEDMMNSIEDYVEEARKDIQKDKDEVAALCARMEQMQGRNGPAAPTRELAAKIAASVEPPAQEKPEKAVLPLPGNLSKNEMVRQLKREGFDEERIARELEISRGEVALILGINKNGHAPI